MPAPAGTSSKKCSSASSPPAEAPSPTMRKSSPPEGSSALSLLDFVGFSPDRSYARHRRNAAALRQELVDRAHARAEFANELVGGARSIFGTSCNRARDRSIHALRQAAP